MNILALSEIANSASCTIDPSEERRCEKWREVYSFLFASGMEVGDEGNTDRVWEVV